jgi:hypothetical protein
MMPEEITQTPAAAPAALSRAAEDYPIFPSEKVVEQPQAKPADQPSPPDISKPPIPMPEQEPAWLAALQAMEVRLKEWVHSEFERIAKATDAEAEAAKVKAWVRREIDLAASGVTADERRDTHNP